MRGLSLVAASRGTLQLWCAGFSLWWLLLLQSLGSRCAGFSSCGAQASLPLSMWDLPEPEIEPVSLALAGGSLTTGSAGMSLQDSFYFLFLLFHKRFNKQICSDVSKVEDQVLGTWSRLPGPRVVLGPRVTEHRLA